MLLIVKYLIKLNSTFDILSTQIQLLLISHKWNYLETNKI